MYYQLNYLNQKQIKRLHREIREILLNHLKDQDKLLGFDNLVRQIKSWHKPIFIKYKPFEIDKFPLLLTELEALHEEEIARQRKGQYKSFLTGVIDLRKDNLLKSYHNKIHNFLRISGGVFVDRIKIDDHDIMTQQDEVDNLIFNKYLNLFAEGSNMKQTVHIELLGSVTQGEVFLAFHTISKNKALGNDLIPDIIFNPEDKKLVEVITDFKISFSQKKSFHQSFRNPDC